MGDNRECIQQKKEKKKNGKGCKKHHELDLHAAIKAEICKCLKTPKSLTSSVFMYPIEEVWVRHIHNIVPLFKIHNHDYLLSLNQCLGNWSLFYSIILFLINISLHDLPFNLSKNSTNIS